MDTLVQSLRLSARRLFRQPGFSCAAVLALGVGIGATVAIFSVFHAVLLRPLPFREPDRLLAIWERNPERGWNKAQVAAANYLDWRASSQSFADMAAYNDWFREQVLVQDGEPIAVLGNEVTGNFFEVLGVQPLEGRVFDDTHTWEGREPAVVLSHAFWSQQIASDIVGKTVELDGVAHRVLGVMPEGFDYPFRGTDLWLPVAWDPELREQVRFRRAHGMRVVGRLAKGVSFSQAEAELAAIAARLETDYPETNRQMGNGVTPLHEWIVGDASRPLQILMAVVGFVLLVACANVSHMLLARTSTRQSELRIRVALGGSRRRLLLEGLVESLSLAALGGALGLLLGRAAIRPLLLMSPEGLPRVGEIGVDVTVIAFAVGISVASGLLVGSVPAWRSAGASLPSGSRGSSPTRRTRRSSSMLVAAEVALTLPLVVGAGLMVRTLAHLSFVDPGFDSQNVLVVKVMVPRTRYDGDEATRFYRSLLDEVRAIPGVDEAAMSTRLPFGNQRWSSDFTAEGWSSDRYGVGVRHDEITPGLFRTMGVPLLRGRDFYTGDVLGAPLVVIINEALAEKYFPGEDPIGRRIVFDRTPDADSHWRTIVGVVGDVRREALSLPEKPSFYAPVSQDTSTQVHLLARTERDPMSVVGAVRESVRALDPGLPIFDVTTLEAIVADSAERERFLLVLLAMAAAVALALASAGIFGVVYHTTMRRAREIGVRIALGARGRSVVSLVIRGGLRPVLVGIVLGVIAAAILARAMSSFLFEVRPLDPWTFACVILLMFAAALMACVLPARWATRVDPTAALRTE